MRILVGVSEIGGVLTIFADGFRQLGHQVTTVVNHTNRFYPHIRYDVNLREDVIQSRVARMTRLLRLILSHDLFFYMWAEESMRWKTELPLLRALGKRIIWTFCGDDVRHSSCYQQQFSSIPLSADHRQRLEKDPLSRPLRNIRIAEKYCDFLISQPNQSGLAVRPYMHSFVPVDLSKYAGTIQGREVPIVVHAPSNSNVKGTDLILAALERIRLEGVHFELRLLQGVSNEQVLSSLNDADVVVDQLHFPMHGGLGVEAMAAGCALSTGNREDYEPFPPNRPIWHIDPGNVYEQLKRLLTDRDLRVRLAVEGREYVKRYHDHVKVARRIIQTLQAGKARRYDHYPTFYAERFQLPDGVLVPSELQRTTGQIVQRWGLPEGADAQDMVRRGLMSADGLKSSQPIPRWNLASVSSEPIAV